MKIYTPSPLEAFYEMLVMADNYALNRPVASKYLNLKPVSLSYLGAAKASFPKSKTTIKRRQKNKMCRKARKSVKNR